MGVERSGPVVRRVTVLGRSAATLSMLFDTLLALHGEGVAATIVSNVETDDALPFATPGVEAVEIPADRWKPPADCDEALLLGVYRPATKRAVVEAFRRSHGVDLARFAVLVHPRASVASTARLGPGTQVGPLAAIAAYAELGPFVSVNRGASVGHHSVVERFGTLNPGCVVAGRCRLGEAVTVGAGAVVIDGVEIGARTVVGAGSVVTRSLPPGVVAYGSPARPVREVEA